MSAKQQEELEYAIKALDAEIESAISQEIMWNIKKRRYLKIKEDLQKKLAELDGDKASRKEGSK